MGGNPWKGLIPRKGEEGATSFVILFYEVTSHHTFNNHKEDKWMWTNGSQRLDIYYCDYECFWSKKCVAHVVHILKLVWKMKRMDFPSVNLK